MADVIVNAGGNFVSAATVDADPWGGETSRSSGAFQPHKFTTYERDANQSDEAMMRRYSRANSRFDQPDPYDGSYDPTDPQSFNRYAYTRNDPVNFVDPSGLDINYTIPAWENGWSQVSNPTLAFMNGALRDFIRDYNWFVREGGGVEVSGFFTNLSFGQGPRPAPLPTPTPVRTPPKANYLDMTSERWIDCLKKEFTKGAIAGFEKEFGKEFHKEEARLNRRNTRDAIFGVLGAAATGGWGALVVLGGAAAVMGDREEDFEDKWAPKIKEYLDANGEKLLHNAEATCGKDPSTYTHVN